MFELFSKQERIRIQDDAVFINDKRGSFAKGCEVHHVFELNHNPEIKVFENDRLIRKFKIDALKSNPVLNGQFFHSSIRIQSNSAVVIDGVISDNDVVHAKWTDDNYEAIRLQPFYLSDKNEYNNKLVGKGLFQRGLHFSGTITPRGVRCVCLCDSCNETFTIQHIHAGFSEMHYFYSANSKETLMLPYSAMPKVLAQNNINIEELESIESKLPNSYDGKFKYFNSFKCPHCLANYIDFEKHREIRQGEYYANTYINETAKLLNVS
ncbi:hypothetical protein [Mucilaginibacter auburnensis]|uniref:Uncharacterized protein n=1 Tax=Mucilaginibacter auburnensis TaxID=1457233 RepID=A0A2H9VTI9_9SPHI|nr:hypothetical protein [Mucilaginibacter auburnensis]PJJ84128.1 hypothetical protein CLV57_1132 [Mucilaginibacter auburnensis]